MDYVEYWDNFYKSIEDKKPVYDDWLDQYEEILAAVKTPILDLGAGDGSDSLYLREKGHEVIAVDYSKEALELIKRNIKGVKVKKADISEPLDFEDESFEVIIADLSLHYFNEQTTIFILKEIKRILKPGGHLMARVNSVDDLNYGALQGKKIEENYYFVNGYNKRFFSLEDANKYFSIIGKCDIKEADMNRYSKPKKVIEILAKK